MASSKGIDEALIDKMFELQEAYRANLEARAANRRSLRDLVAQGLLSPEQVAVVEEVYPERAPRGSRTEVA